MPPREFKSRSRHHPQVALNLNIRGMKHSATVAINRHSHDLIAGGRRIFKLGLGQSPFPVPPSVVEELRAHAGEKDYLPVAGLPELQRAVAGYVERRNHVRRLPSDVLVGPGSKELMFLLQLVYYGDLVVPTPCWVSYAPQARIIGRNIRFLPADRDDEWKLTPEALDAHCRADPDRPRIVVLNYPNNPTGGTYRLDQIKELAEVARRYRVILLSDEIYGELHHRGRHVSIARFYPEGTIISGGLSKWCGAGGWRLGVFVFPPTLAWLRDAMAAVASETYTSTSAPIQYAAVRAYDGDPGIEAYLHDSRSILRALGRWCHDRLVPCGVDLVRPEGAFYLFPDFSPLAPKLAGHGITDPDALCRRILDETGVAMIPGTEFGRPSGELTARIAYVDFDGGAALAALRDWPRGKRLRDGFLQGHCAVTLEAIDRLVGWLASL